MKIKLLNLFFILLLLPAYGQTITFTTTSNSANWSPAAVTNSGTILKWTVEGEGIVQQTVEANDPVFDLSTNSGIVNITIESLDRFVGEHR